MRIIVAIFCVFALIYLFTFGLWTVSSLIIAGFLIYYLTYGWRKATDYDEMDHDE